MNKFYKPLENLNQEDLVRFISIGNQEQGKFGAQYQCNVEVNGEAMVWTLSGAKLKQFTEAGFKQGDTVKIQKWREGIKKGYNFISPDKKNPYKQPEQTTPYPDTSRFVSEEKPDNFQEKVSRGAAFNLAFQYAVKKSENSDLKAILNSTVQYAKEIATTQQMFVNNLL